MCHSLQEPEFTSNVIYTVQLREFNLQFPQIQTSFSH